jgi:antagonist of KipI
MRFSPLGDSAVVAEWGDSVAPATLRAVRAFATALASARLAGITEIVPAFTSVAVFYEPLKFGSETESPCAHVCRQLAAFGKATGTATEMSEGRTVTIPVCYGAEFGPDLAAVAAHASLSVDEVIQLHAGTEYLVHAIGFAPGFPYLGGLPEKLHMPRQATPRASVPAGSVGIGGAQTGVYPLATPGGWQLIGRTPLALFDPHRAEPALLRAGDRVKFSPMTREAFLSARAPASAPAPAQPPEPKCHVIRDTTAMALPSDGSEKCHVLRDTLSAVRVVQPGMFTTLQDLGRRGHRAAGVPWSGAADAVALRVANLLVGNPEGALALEFTLIGPELEFTVDAVIALGGAEFPGLPRWEPVKVPAGKTISFGAARSGCRGYLAIAGGFAAEPVLGSGSTYVRGGFGGHAGRALRAGDVLQNTPAQRRLGGRWHIDERILPRYAGTPTVRVVRGAQAEQFSAGLYENEFKVSPQSDRMGLRLSGVALQRNDSRELLSTAVAPGTIQVPPDGQPIVLLADAQTIGGYPQAGHVITADLPLVAQLRPGDHVRFTEVSIAEAQKLLITREHALAILHEGLAQKFG